jgi:DNA invertase Pin-like site-specific DNA recombinase
VRKGKKFVILARVSSHEQGRRKNQNAQVRHLRKEVKKRGGIVAKVIREEYSGWGPSWLTKLMLIGHDMEEKHPGATLLVASPDRLLRSSGFKSTDKTRCQFQPTRDELASLGMFEVYGIPVMSFIHPDSTPAECRALLIGWGQKQRKRKGGRPIKRRDRFKMKYLPLVMKLFKKRWTLRSIAKKIGDEAGRSISIGTLHTWVKETPPSRNLARGSVRKGVLPTL